MYFRVFVVFGVDELEYLILHIFFMPGFMHAAVKFYRVNEFHSFLLHTRW